MGVVKVWRDFFWDGEGRWGLVKKAATVFVLLGLVASVAVIAGRQRAVQSPGQVEIVLDLDSARGLAATRGFDLVSFLEQMKQAGVGGLGISSVGLQELADFGPEAVVPATRFFALASSTTGTGPLPAGLARVNANTLLSLARTYPQGVFILGSDPQREHWIDQELSRRVGPAGYSHVALDHSQGGPAWAFLIHGVSYTYQAKPTSASPFAPRYVYNFSLGLDPQQVSLARQVGLVPVPVLTGLDGLSPDEVREFLDAAKSIPARPYGQTGVPVVISWGKKPLGAPDLISAVGQIAARAGVAVGIDPAQDQIGAGELAAAAGWNVVKVHEMGTWESVEGEGDWARERGARLFYIYPAPATGMGAAQTQQASLDLVAGLKARFTEVGFRLGPAVPVRPYAPPPLLVVLVGMGILAGLVFLILVFPGIPERVREWLMASLLPGFVVLGLAARLDTARQAMALLSALVWPSLGVVMIGEWWERRRLHPEAVAGWRVWLGGAGAVVAASVPAMVGGFLLNGMLGSIAYALQLEEFRGIKLAYITPPLVALVFAAVKAWHREQAARAPGWRVFQTAMELARQEVSLGEVLMGAAGAAAGVVMLARSGNVNLFHFPVETWIRSKVAALLSVRARDKEFLVGHPSGVMGGYAAARLSRMWLWPFLVGFALAELSITNSFSHIHTPVLISLWRTANGLLLGIGLGLAGTGVLWAAGRLWPDLMGRVVEPGVAGRSASGKTE